MSRNIKSSPHIHSGNQKKAKIKSEYIERKLDHSIKHTLPHKRKDVVVLPMQSKPEQLLTVR